MHHRLQSSPDRAEARQAQLVHSCGEQCGHHAGAITRLAEGVLTELGVADAIALGAALADAPRQESFGAEAWLLDPEGNRLLLLVLA